MKKRTLRFKLKGLVLMENGDFSNIVRGSEGYLNCQFIFSEEWKNTTVIASFSNKGKEYATLVKKNMTDTSEEGVCYIPNEALTGPFFTLYLVGLNKKNNYKIASTKITVRQV